MKEHLKLALLACSLLTAASVKAETIYSENFDSMAAGQSIYSQSTDWTRAYGGENDGSVMVQAGGALGTANYLKHQCSGLYAVHCAIPGTVGIGENYNLKFSFMIKAIDWKKDLWFGNSAQGMGEFEVLKDGENSRIKFHIDNKDIFSIRTKGHLSDWTPVSYTINTAAGRERLIDFTFGDTVVKGTNVIISTSNQDRYDTFRLMGWGSNAAWGFDNFTVEAISNAGEGALLSAPDSAAIGIGTNSASFAISNIGKGTITYSLSSETSWLNFSPASGSFKDSQTITIRSADSLARGYYSGDLVIDAGTAGKKTVKVCCQNGFIYVENFDGFVAGQSILSQDKRWTQDYGGSQNADFDITAGGAEGSANYLKYVSRYFIASECELDNAKNLGKNYNLKISFLVKALNWNNDLWFGNSHEKMGEFKIQKNGSGSRLSLNESSFSITADGQFEDWTPVSYTINTQAGDERLIDLTFGSTVITGTNFLMKTNNKDEYNSFRVFINGGGSEWGIDSLSVECIERDTSKPELSAPSSASIGIDEDTASFKIVNKGTGTISYSISSSEKWLAAAPESGSFEDSATIVLTRAKDAPRGYYTAIVSVDGGKAGRQDLKVTCQNGFLYAENFDGLTADKSIMDQDSLWTIAWGSRENGDAIVRSGGYDGSANKLSHEATSLFATHVNLANSKNLGSKYNLKFSFMVKCETWNADLWFGNSAQGLGEFKILKDEGGTKIELDKVGTVVARNSGDLSEWTPVCYTLNTTAGNARLLEFEFGDSGVQEMNVLIASDRQDNFETFRLANWGGSSVWDIDDLKIECVERGAEGPKLDVTGGGMAYYGTESLEMTVFNVGQGNMEYETSVTEGSGWLTIKEANGAESYKGSLAAGKSQKLTLLIDRDSLGLEYGRAVIATESGKQKAEIRANVQGCTAEGIVFYASDFESSNIGPVAETDPAWNASNADVISDEGNNCLAIVAPDQSHIKVKVPDSLYDKYDFRFSCKMKFPEEGLAYSGNCFGTDLGHRQGEYNISVDEQNNVRLTSGDAHLDSGNITNVCRECEWFDLSYTYNADPLNRKLKAVTFGDSNYEFEDQYIDNASETSGGFDEFRIYTWHTESHCPYYLDDIRLEAVLKSQDDPKMSVSCKSLPVPYDSSEVTFTVKNDGGRCFDFVSEVIEGGEYLKAATNGTVYGSFQFKGAIDRSKLGAKFYRAKVRFTSATPGVEPVFVTVGIQSGNATDGIVIYESSFSGLELTSESEGVLVNELSGQDLCWQKNTDHNRIDIVEDPAGSGKKVAKIVNANGWTDYPGYTLSLNVKPAAWDSYDIVYDMDFYFPDTFVERKGEEHPDALFYFTQNNDNRMCEFEFSLDSEDNFQSVAIKPQDITNTEWWDNNKGSMAKVSNNSWFKFYHRMNGKLADFDHKTLYALNFGENEYQMQGDDSALTYPGGISPEVLSNEKLSKMKFWCYCDNAGICLDNVKIMLVPKGLPEPAIMSLMALLLAMLGRKRP